MYTYKPTQSDTHALQQGESWNIYIYIYIMQFPVLSSCELIAVPRKLRFYKEISKANWILFPSHTVIIRYNEAVKCDILLPVWLSTTGAGRWRRSRHPTKTMTPPPSRERAVTITNSLSGLARADLLSNSCHVCRNSTRRTWLVLTSFCNVCSLSGVRWGSLGVLGDLFKHFVVKCIKQSLL